MLAKPLTFIIILVTTLLSTAIARPLPTPTSDIKDVSSLPLQGYYHDSRKLTVVTLTGLRRDNKLKSRTSRRNRVKRSRHRAESSHGIVAYDFAID
jgi:hypothetical protein